jgi:uncharacterized protein
VATLELQRLWKLHEIDAAIVEIRTRAAALDPGRKAQAELQALEAKHAEVGGKARGLSQELQDLELGQQGIADKLKRIERDMYGGKVTSPREVEALEKEIASLKRQRDANDERILELWETLPPAKEAAERLERQIEAKKAEVAEARKRAIEEKKRLEEEFARLTKLRPEATGGISPNLLARYDAIRQKHGGLGMAEVARGVHCGGCGTLLPERTLAGLKDDKSMTCESCHRILYLREGIV